MALSATEEDALSRFAAAVRAALCDRVESIRSFGSRARGEGCDDRDLDV